MAGVTVDCTPLNQALTSGGGGCGGWAELPAHWHLVLPGIGIGIGLFAVEKAADHLPPAAAKFAIPGLLLAIPVWFYLLLLATGTSVAEARQDGWLQDAGDSPDAGSAAGAGFSAAAAAGADGGLDPGLMYWVGPWAPFFKGRVVWSALPGCLPEWAAMVCVVCFGSLLDVAAIKVSERLSVFTACAVVLPLACQRLGSSSAAWPPSAHTLPPLGHT